MKREVFYRKTLEDEAGARGPVRIDQTVRKTRIGVELLCGQHMSPLRREERSCLGYPHTTVI